MDRNSIIGFVLLLLLGTGYVLWNNHEQKTYLAQSAKDSVAKAQLAARLPDSATLAQTPGDTAGLLGSSGSDSAQNADTVFHGQVAYTHLQNNLLDLKFSNQGGFPVEATLKKFNNYGGGIVHYFDGKDNRLDFQIPFNGKMISTDQMFFTPNLTTLNNGDQRLTMTAHPAPGKSVVLSYDLPKDAYMMNAGFSLVGFSTELNTVKSIPFVWSTQPLKTEKDMENERYYLQTHLQYTDGDNDYFPIKQTEKMKTLKKPVRWFSVRSHFFNSTIIADAPMEDAHFQTTTDEKNDSTVIASQVNNFSLPVANAGNQYNFGFRWLISPNDYHLLRSYDLGLDEIISLGYGPFFFVKYISKWIIIPLFDVIVKVIGNIGISIILLIFVIRLFLSFFSYKSYLSNAKMKALKPELEELKKKFGKNQQQMGMEQMKLYRTAGVNPLGGCLPMLLQMPFLLAVYYFIPTAIELRQIPFLWAPDLSTYDSIFSLPFKIPLYGSHVSLFTLLMAATSLLLALFNKNMMGGGAAAPAGGTNAEMQKMMKYMPYVMPFMFLGWFNSMAAGLTLYYTCSNLISLGQQGVIQKYFINEKAIHAKIAEKRSRPEAKKASKWQQRLEEMQKLQQERTKVKK